MVQSYNAFNMKFEPDGHGQGGVLGGDNKRELPTAAAMRGSPSPSKGGVSSPSTVGKTRTKSKAPVSSSPKAKPRGPRAAAADKRRREAEAAVWGRARMQQETQIRGMTIF